MLVQLYILSAIVQMFTVNFYTLKYCKCYVFYFKAEFFSDLSVFSEFLVALNE